MRDWRLVVGGIVACVLASCGSSSSSQPTNAPGSIAEPSTDEIGWVDGAAFEWSYERLEPSSDECPVFMMVFVDTTEGDVVERLWEFPEEWREPGFSEREQLIGPLDGTVTLTVTFENGEKSQIEREAFNEKADCASGSGDTTTTGDLASAVSTPQEGSAIDGATECPAADGSSERVTSFSEEPPRCIDIAATYRAEVVTNLGTFVVDLDAERAPNTVNNFVVLARYHFYDGVLFHRVIPGFVVQGGDAVGTPLGTGGPGYSIADELPDAGSYLVGSVAMANSGPNSNGSQFFVITGADGVSLPPLYSLFGEVTAGLDVVTAIENIPTVEGDVPSEPAIIESVTITEG